MLIGHITMLVPFCLLRIFSNNMFMVPSKRRIPQGGACASVYPSLFAYLPFVYAYNFFSKKKSIHVICLI